MSLLLINFALLVVYMTFWYAFGRSKQRLDVADTAWGGGFIIVALSSVVFYNSANTVLLLALVILWGARLALHIRRRNIFNGPDPRYDVLSARWKKDGFWIRAYFSVFIVQSILIFLVSLPITLTALSKSSPNTVIVTIGASVWLIGFVFETIADLQLKKFVTSSHKSGDILKSGLWRYSRHPNYFGEIVLWLGISVIAIGAHASWLLLIGPVIISSLLLFVSGIPTIEQRYKSNSKYRVYARQTSILIPWPPLK